MKRRKFIANVGLLASASGLASYLSAFAQGEDRGTTLTHRIMSCNVRTPKRADEKAGDGWDARKEFCLEIIGKYSPDVICLQECTPIQYQDFLNHFSGFTAYAIRPGEYDLGNTQSDVIFFSSRYDLISSSSYWLSETPEVPDSKSWDAKYPRFVNWVRLQDKVTGVEFRVANTHFDHKGAVARSNSARIILSDFGGYPPTYPQVLVGDLNTTGADEPAKILIQGGLEDTYAKVNRLGDPGFTAHNFLGEKFSNPDAWGKIDWIFSRGNVETIASMLIKDRKGDRYPSDHYFLLGEYRISAPLPRVKRLS